MKRIDTLQAQIETLQKEQIRLCLKKIEQMARAIMRKRKHIKEFVMAMGCYSFTDNKGNGIDPISERMNSSYNYYYVDTFAYFKPLNDFIGKWNEHLKLTGNPMRFTATSKVKTNW